MTKAIEQAEPATGRAAEPPAAGRRPRRLLPKMAATPNANGSLELNIDYPGDPADGWQLLAQSLGSTQAKFAEGLISELGGISCNAHGSLDSNRLAINLAMAQGIEPTDEIEGMLAVQMAAIHRATMDYAARLAQCKVAATREDVERSLNRLARTFAAQVDALKRHRTKGEQKVIVEHQHVHVYQGGQAVVGTVNNGVGGGCAENGGQSLERGQQLRLSESAAVLGAIEADRLPMPRSGAEGEEGLPLPRRQGRRALRAV